MSVKKIFMTLIVVVVCVIIGAFVINILVPNATTVLIDAVEDQVFNATGMSLDFNNNSDAGSGGQINQSGARTGAEDNVANQNTVQGFPVK